MNLLFAASEATPLARTSFMGDVVSALPRALLDLGMGAALVIPRYKHIPAAFSLEPVAQNIPVPIGDHHKTVDLLLTRLDNLDVYLVDQPDYYWRDGLYHHENGDYLDNAERFIFFSRAVVELIPFYKNVPDIIHCHDWQTGLTPLYLKRFKAAKTQYRQIKSLFTIHNLVQQGLFWRFDMHLTGLPWNYFTPDGIEFYGDLNLLKAGVLYANMVNTVSPRYCREIQTAEFGCGLDDVLRSLKHKLCGILNGADYDYWSPVDNPDIPAAYSPDDLSGKTVCKNALITRAKLNPDTHGPLLCMVTPLFSRKGVDLLETLIPELVEKKFRIILQGVGDRNYVNIFSEMADRFHGAFTFFHNLDPEQSRLIIAGSDMLLKPSRFEPCGLNQIYALRFGTIPIVRRTGGLDDTVIDENEHADGIRTGFKFDHYSVESMRSAIHRALTAFGQSGYWNTLIKSAMDQDFSWRKSAEQYAEIYQQIIQTG